ncbi:hypothetical protein SAMN05216464_110215 [Mucilaginibacter pineti]|uniref:Uncharacterized protein n=1 Tax=Mucilaginibacter pineti TaxID=1391627 RepID=A0A1G7GMH0_9SPHI|nr:hypothetical protein SAMN05216464_110215 [Mucilaginibacter pineti]
MADDNKISIDVTITGEQESTALATQIIQELVNYSSP